jgi:GTP:adenosylcobinamide-phosphate guanylyltransferase
VIYVTDLFYQIDLIEKDELPIMIASMDINLIGSMNIKSIGSITIKRIESMLIISDLLPTSNDTMAQAQ